MSKELNEDTSFKVSVKTLIAIGLGLSTLIGMWFTLQADIAEAKELAYWRLHTQTRPSIQPTVSYEMIRLSKNKPANEL